MDKFKFEELTDCDALLTILAIATNDLALYARRIDCLIQSNSLRKIGDILMLIHEMRDLVYVEAPFLQPDFEHSGLSAERLNLRRIVENESFNTVDQTIRDYEVLREKTSVELRQFIDVRIKLLKLDTSY